MSKQRGEPDYFTYVINGHHRGISETMPPDDSYDAGTLSPLYIAPQPSALQSQDREGDDLKEVGKQAVRWAPSSAYWSAELTRLFGPDAREGINVLEARLRDFEVDALRWRYMRRKLCLTGNGNGTCAMQAINLPAAIPGWPEPGAVAEFCDAAIDAARKGQ